ncbi:hypothetical protein ABPG72_017234 [Tetrahymena utriculariae]
MSNSKIKIKEQPDQNYLQNSFNQNLENKASCISKALFLWTTKVIKLGNSKLLKESDLFDLREEERLETVLHQIQQVLLNDKNRDFISAIFKTNKASLLLLAVLTILISGLSFAGPIFLNLIIKNISDQFSNPSQGYLYTSLLFACFVLKAFLTQHLTLQTNRITFQVILNFFILTIKRRQF